MAENRDGSLNYPREICDFCKEKNLPQTSEEEAGVLCTGVEWLCQYRTELIAPYPEIEVPQNKLLTNAEYVRMISNIAKNEKFLVMKKVLLIVEFNRKLRSSQPHLKELCDFIDVALVEGDMFNENEKFSQVKTFTTTPFPMCVMGKELEKDSVPIDILKAPHPDELKTPFSLVDHIISLTCGCGPLEHFKEPCTFCYELKKANPSQDIHCSGNEKLDTHIYECLLQMPPQMKTPQRWYYEAMQCHEEGNYFDRVNHIFLIPNLFRAAMLLINFDNFILPVHPDMKKIIILTEAIILKGVHMLDKKYFTPLSKLPRALDSIRFFDDKEDDDEENSDEEEPNFFHFSLDD